MSTKLKFSEIRSSEDYALANKPWVAAINSAPEADRQDGLDLMALVESKRWHGKIEYPVQEPHKPHKVNVKSGVFHSSSMYIYRGKWRFERTEFNKEVDFRKDHE